MSILRWSAERLLGEFLCLQDKLTKVQDLKQNYGVYVHRSGLLLHLISPYLFVNEEVENRCWFLYCHHIKTTCILIKNDLVQALGETCRSGWLRTDLCCLGRIMSAAQWLQSSSYFVILLHVCVPITTIFNSNWKLNKIHTFPEFLVLQFIVPDHIVMIMLTMHNVYNSYITQS